MVRENELKKKWKKAVLAQFGRLFRTCLQTKKKKGTAVRVHGIGHQIWNRDFSNTNQRFYKLNRYVQMYYETDHIYIEYETHLSLHMTWNIMSVYNIKYSVRVEYKSDYVGREYKWNCVRT